MTLLAPLFSLQGVVGAFLLRGEDTGDTGLCFWPQPPELEEEEEPQELVLAPKCLFMARSTDLLKRSPTVDFFTTLKRN